MDSATAAMIAGSSANSEMSPFIAGLRKYSRDQERQADLHGMNYLTRQGYDPHAMLRTMEIIKDTSATGSMPEFLSTHPTPDNRQEYLQAEIDRKYCQSMQGKTNAEQFQRIIFGATQGRGG